MGLVLITHDLGVVADGRRRRDGDVRRPHRRAGADAAGVRRPGPPVHQGAAASRCPAASATESSGARSRLDVIPGRPPRPGAVPAGCPFHPRCDAASDVCRTTSPPLRRARRAAAPALCHFAEEVLRWRRMADPSDVILEVRDLSKVFPVAAGVVLRQTVGRGAGGRRRLASTCARARRSGWSASPAAASRPWPGLLIGVERPTAGQVLLRRRATCRRCRGRRCASCAAACRWCSRTPTRRSTRA